MLISTLILYYNVNIILKLIFNLCNKSHDNESFANLFNYYLKFINLINRREDRKKKIEDRRYIFAFKYR